MALLLLLPLPLPLQALTAELLLQLADKALLDLVEGLEQAEGHPDEDGLAARRHVDLAAGGQAAQHPRQQCAIDITNVTRTLITPDYCFAHVVSASAADGVTTARLAPPPSPLAALPRARFAAAPTSCAPAIHRSRRSPLSSALVASRSNSACRGKGRGGSRSTHK